MARPAAISSTKFACDKGFKIGGISSDFTGLTFNSYDGTNLWGTAGALEDGDRDGEDEDDGSDDASAGETQGAAKKKKCFCLPDTSASATPLQQNVEKLGSKIGILAIGVCVAVFVIGVIMGTANPADPETPPCGHGPVDADLDAPGVV